MSQGSYPQYPPPPPPPPQYPQYPHPQQGQQPGVPGAVGPYPGAPYPYGAFPPGYAPWPLKHSGVGIASLLLAVISVLGLVGTCVGAVIVGADDPSILENESAPVTIALSVTALVCLLFSLVGVALGIGGLAQRERKRAFPIVGLSINTIILLLVLGLVVFNVANS